MLWAVGLWAGRNERGEVGANYEGDGGVEGVVVEEEGKEQGDGDQGTWCGSVRLKSRARKVIEDYTITGRRWRRCL